jgi:hypothetical protein
MAFTRLEAVGSDQAASNRPTNQSAKDQAKGGACHRQFHHAGYILHIRKAFGIGGPGTVATRQGD